ncbi:MAG: FG-GAP repeat protein [Candidatus Midichloria sp.]|nr:FG-GAP repeat protein [Candidatus Midichloria sp.]
MGIFELSSLSSSTALGLVINGYDEEDYLGWSIGAGDINGDGRNDIVCWSSWRRPC